jgi:hypothetical protein
MAGEWMEGKDRSRKSCGYLTGCGCLLLVFIVIVVIVLVVRGIR